MGTKYDEQFYETITDGAARSADIVAPYIYRTWGRPQRVVDVGCGRGAWAREFEKLGASVVGVDGPWVTEPLIDSFHAHDLTQPIPEALGSFDLAVCVEVAEHLPAARAAGLVNDLCRLAPVVLFSAAIPWQTGTGHINCQWPSYWARLFAEHGYGPVDDVRWDIWTDERVEVWYRQNLMIFTSGAAPVINPGELDVVHPEIHAWGRS